MASRVMQKVVLFASLMKSYAGVASSLELLYGTGYARSEGAEFGSTGMRIPSISTLYHQLTGRYCSPIQQGAHEIFFWQPEWDATTGGGEWSGSMGVRLGYRGKLTERTAFGFNTCLDLSGWYAANFGVAKRVSCVTPRWWVMAEGVWSSLFVCGSFQVPLRQVDTAKSGYSYTKEGAIQVWNGEDPRKPPVIMSSCAPSVELQLAWQPKPFLSGMLGVERLFGSYAYLPLQRRGARDPCFVHLELSGSLPSYLAWRTSYRCTVGPRMSRHQVRLQYQLQCGPPSSSYYEHGGSIEVNGLAKFPLHPLDSKGFLYAENLLQPEKRFGREVHEVFARSVGEKTVTAILAKAR